MTAPRPATVTPLPDPAKPIGELVSRIVAKSTRRKQLREAHEHASAFHAAMERALEAEAELECEDATDRDLLAAVVAMHKMPAKWRAVLEAELPKHVRSTSS